MASISILGPDIVRIIAQYVYGSPTISESSDNITDIKFFANNAFLYGQCICQCCFCAKTSYCHLYTVYNGISYGKLYSCDDCKDNAYKYCLLAERASILKSDIIISRSDGSFSFATIQNIYRRSMSIFSEPMVVCGIDERKYTSISNLIANISPNQPNQNFEICKTIYHRELIEIMTKFLLFFI